MTPVDPTVVFNLVVNALFPIVALCVGLAFVFNIVYMMSKALMGWTGDNDSEPPAHLKKPPTPPAPPPPPPAPAKRSGGVWMDIATVIELVRLATRPANCPNCGAPMPSNSRKCAHCGTEA
jgi:zinc ribbon protein